MADSATARKEQILDAALAVFVKLGYRKATMADVAQAAEISRQGIYLHFANKQQLLTAAVEHELERSLGAAREALSTAGNLADRLTDALDEWLGKGSGESADDVAILGRENAAELAATFDVARRRFVHELAAAIESERHIDHRQALIAAATLHATATGWKHLAHDRADFRARVSQAAPLVVNGAAASRG